MSFILFLVTAHYANSLMILIGTQATIFQSSAWLKSGYKEGYIF